MSVHTINKYPISSSVRQYAFRFKELDMRFESDALKIRLKAPLLKAHNYTITLENGILTLRVMTEKLYMNKSQVLKTPVFIESFLSIPNPSYTYIKEHSFVENSLQITIVKKQTEERFVTPYGIT